MKETYSYKVLKSSCKNKYKNIKVIPRVYDRLVDRRGGKIKGEISCGCCMPPKDIEIELTNIEVSPKTTPSAKHNSSFIQDCSVGCLANNKGTCMVNATKCEPYNTSRQS